MKGLRRWLVVCAVPALVSGTVLRGQQPNATHVGYVYPAGGQRGTTVQVKVGGRLLDGASAVLASGRGIHARFVSLDKPLTGQQITALRERLQELQKQGNTPALQSEIADARIRIGDSLRRNANPMLAEIGTLEIVIDRDAEPGQRQLRVLTPLGLSNPLVFSVGQLPEFREKDEKRGRADAELPITLPATVNGRIVPGDVDSLQFPLRQAQQYMPGDVDRYRFHALEGQHLVITASARDLMPYLADAVPGWFQATLTLFDASGRELAYDDDYRFHPDPVLFFEVPAEGDYVVEIRDALYRGRDDFVYRITLGEVPFVTSVFPLGGRAGARTSVELAGWNLASARLILDEHGKPPGVQAITVAGGSRHATGSGASGEPYLSNPVAFALDAVREVFEHEPNDAQKDAQSISLPVVVNGRIDRPGDRDVFTFKGRRGDRIVAEVLARRLGSPLDSTLELTGAAGGRVAFNDDHDDTGAGLETHHADSLLTATLPATGTYYIRLGDVQHHGGAEYAYRLRVGPPRPDFDLRVSPSSVNGRANGSVPLTVHALRRDGFTGDIALALQDAPRGLALSGGTLPAGQDEVRVTLTLPPGLSAEPYVLRLEGRATIDGRTVVREAVPAEDMMQAFAYRHLVPTDALRVAVAGRGGTRVPARVLADLPVKIAGGGRARVPVALPPGYRAFQNLRFELSEPPAGITLRDSPAEPAAGVLTGPLAAEFFLLVDATKIAPGTRGNLIVVVSGERVPGPDQRGAGARPRVPIATLPAIPFEIVKR